MKRITAILLASILLLLPLPGFAEGETPEAGATESPHATASPTATPAPTVKAATGLAIDSRNVYDGMDQAFSNGYTPRVRSGKAAVVLPLVADGAVRGNTVTAALGLGEPSSAPFVFKNYQKAVALAANKVKGGGTVSSYLVRFDLALRKDRVNGAYPVTVNISAVATDGTAIQQSYTWYVVITDGKDPNAPEPTPEPAAPEVQPRLVVSAYRLNPAPAVAGQEVKVTVTLRNTSQTQSVKGVRVVATCDSPDFSLLNDSNTLLLDGIGKGGTADIELKYSVGLKAAPQQYGISLAIEYDTEQAVTLSSSGTVAVPVTQPLRVEMEAPRIASAVNAGDTLPLSFQVMNLGRATVYNVRCTVEAPGFLSSGAAFLGNMEAGTAKTGELDVFIGTKDMSEGHGKDDKYGPTNGTITLIYEDEAGKEYTEKTEFTSMINEPVIPAATETEEETGNAGQWWLTVGIAAAAVAALAVLLVVRGRRAKRHESA